MDIYNDERNNPYSKKNVVSKIKSSPISFFYGEGSTEELPDLSYPDKGTIRFKLERQVGVMVADLEKQSDEMIFKEVVKIIRENNLSDLYVINRSFIFCVRCNLWNNLWRYIYKEIPERR